MRGVGLRVVAVVLLLSRRHEEHAIETFEQPRRFGEEEMRVMDRDRTCRRKFRVS